MADNITFGWRVPDFPDQPTTVEDFRQQIFDYTDVLQSGGLDSVWVGDHFFPWPADVDQTTDTIESFSTLTYLMARYPRMRGGTIVLSQGYRPPALLAKMSANLQWISGGRFILGIGAGWKENEYLAYGYDYPSAGVRLAQLEESVQIIRRMWSDPDPSFQGKYYHIEQAYAAPRPNPAPPLLIGGDGPKVTLRIVAQYADWCNLNGVSVDYCRDRLKILKQHCQNVGRDYAQILKTYSCDAVAVAETHAKAEQLVHDSYFGKFHAIYGTPDEVFAQIQPFIDLGFAHFIFRFVDFPHPESAQLFMQEVMPRFTQAH